MCIIPLILYEKPQKGTTYTRDSDKGLQKSILYFNPLDVDTEIR